MASAIVAALHHDHPHVRGRPAALFAAAAVAGRVVHLRADDTRPEC